MAIEDATFVVQRGDEKFSCLGSDLGDKLQDDDLLIAQRGDNHGSVVKNNIDDSDLFVVTDGDNGHKSVTGAQVKELWNEAEPDPPADPVQTVIEFDDFTGCSPISAIVTEIGYPAEECSGGYMETIFEVYKDGSWSVRFNSPDPDIPRHTYDILDIDHTNSKHSLTVRARSKWVSSLGDFVYSEYSEPISVEGDATKPGDRLIQALQTNKKAHVIYAPSSTSNYRVNIRQYIDLGSGGDPCMAVEAIPCLGFSYTGYSASAQQPNQHTFYDGGKGGWIPNYTNLGFGPLYLKEWTIFMAQMTPENFYNGHDPGTSESKHNGMNDVIDDIVYYECWLALRNGTLVWNEYGWIEWSTGKSIEQNFTDPSAPIP